MLGRHSLREAKTVALNRALGLKGRRQVLLLAEEDACLSKFTYKTWDEAEIVARRTMDDIPMRRNLLAYRCYFCERWHVGGDAPRIRNRCLSGSPDGWSYGGWRVLRKLDPDAD